MNRQELLDDFNARGIADRIIIDTVTKEAEKGIDIHRLSFLEVVGNAAIVRTIPYLHIVATDEAWYGDQEPEAMLQPRIEQMATQKAAMSAQSAQLKI
jgi:hypothetical protein